MRGKAMNSAVTLTSPVQSQQVQAHHSIWRTSFRFALVMTLAFGLGYPLIVTGVAGAVFPHQAAGSLIERNGQVLGSELLAQSFASDRYFHPRPSAAGNGYDATASGGSNYAQSNAKLVQRMQGDIDKLAAENPGHLVPIDAVTASASGLDPDISPDNAYFQARRVAKARSIPEQQLTQLIRLHTHPRTLELFGEPRVNVLELNLAMDQIAK
jgi:potassium-transporting ATPase KdpC subunit